MKELKMYSEIKDLQRRGFSIRQSASILKISRTTVKKYREMTLEEYMKTAEVIKKLSYLDEYKQIIIDWLKDFPSMTAAQVYDWLLEHYNIDISERSVSRYVKKLREEYNIPKAVSPREYEAMDELPMGHQMQLDFGVYNMPLANRKGHKKVYFLATVLSHSRYKYGYFQDKPFTTQDLIYGMNLMFKYYGGTTNEIVVDQDSIIVVSENNGDIIYTYEFERFKQEHNLNIWVCRRADPETKGQVENVVKYIKRNYLPHRTYLEPDDLNLSFQAWLDRTGNGKTHKTTKKVPSKVFEFEREHLRPILFKEKHFSDSSISRTVRKDNTILYCSNRYSLPLGTYTKHKEVGIILNEDKLIIYNEFYDYIITEHKINLSKGQLIKLSEHKRDRETTLNKFEEKLLTLLKESDHHDQWGLHLKEVRRRKPRYYRDQLSVLDQLLKEYNIGILDEALIYCGCNELYSINDISNACKYMNQYNIDMCDKLDIEPNYKPVNNPEVMNVITQKRALNEYDLTGGAAYE
jgi:transposase